MDFKVSNSYTVIQFKTLSKCHIYFLCLSCSFSLFLTQGLKLSSQTDLVVKTRALKSAMSNIIFFR